MRARGLTLGTLLAKRCEVQGIGNASPDLPALAWRADQGGAALAEEEGSGKGESCAQWRPRGGRPPGGGRMALALRPPSDGGTLSLPALH